VPSLGSVVTIRYCEVRPDYYPLVNSIWSMPRDNRFDVIPILSSFSSGSDWEDIESFRQRLQGWFGVGHRAVTKEDFWYIVRSVDGVGKVQVVDVKDNFNAPFREAEVYITDSAGGVPSQDILDRVKGFLDSVGSVGVLYTVKPVQLVSVVVYVKVYISKVYLSTAVQGRVIDVIKNLYSNLEIQEWVSTDRLKREVLQIEGVRSCEVILPSTDIVLKKGQKVVLDQVRVDVFVGGV